MLAGEAPDLGVWVARLTWERGKGAEPLGTQVAQAAQSPLSVWATVTLSSLFQDSWRREPHPPCPQFLPRAGSRVRLWVWGGRDLGQACRGTGKGTDRGQPPPRVC